MIEPTQANRSVNPAANAISAARPHNQTQSALPPCAKKQMLVPKTLEFDLQRIANEAEADDASAQEYMPFAQAKSMGLSEAVNQILDSVLQDHATLLSNNAKTAIQQGGGLRIYLLEKMDNASRAEELFAAFNQFLGASLKLKNASLSKSSLESILGLPVSELNCLDGMYERISMASRNIASISSLPKRLHLCVVDKLFSQIERQSQHLHLGNQVHRRWNASSYQFLADHQSEYQTLMLTEINQLISEEIEPVLKSIENAVYEKSAMDPYSLLKQLGEDKADVVGLFHPHVPDTGSNQGVSGDDAGQGLFHETRAYFGDPDEDTFMPVRLNRDQIYSNLFSRLRNHIEPVSKVAVVLSNPECAVGLAKGVFDSDEKNLLNLTDAELSLSSNDDFVTAERNNALIEKVRARLPIYLEAKSASLNLLLENNLIDVKSMLQSPFFKQSLNDLLVLPFLEKQESIAFSGNRGSLIHVTNYKKTIHPSKIDQFADVAIKLYARAITQGIGPAERIRLKNSITSQCEGVDWTELNKLENACLYAEAARRGNLQAVNGIHAYLLDNNFPDGPIFTALKEHLGSALTQALETANIEVLVESFKIYPHVLDPVDFTEASCVLLKRLGELAQSRSNNQMVCKALDAIQSYYFKGPGEAYPELTLRVMATMAQNMGKFRAAKLLSSPQTIVKGGLARSQDPQTKAYKLIKQYLLKQADTTGQLKMEFLKNLWSSEAIGQFSDASRSLSAKHWKKLITSVAGNAVLYGSSAAGLDLFAVQISDTVAQVGEEIVNVKQAIQDSAPGVQRAAAELSETQNVLDHLESFKQEGEETIAFLEGRKEEWYGKQSLVLEQMEELETKYRNDGKEAALLECLDAVFHAEQQDQSFAWHIRNDWEWEELDSSGLSLEAQQVYNEFLTLKNEYDSVNNQLNAIQNLIEQENQQQSVLDNRILEFAQQAEELTKQANVTEKLTEQLASMNLSLDTTLALQNKINKLSKAMPALAEGVAMLGRGAVGTAGRVASSVAKEASTWGPIGVQKTLQTAYSMTQKNPLASVRDASVLLTPAAIEHFVIQSKNENSANNYLEDAAGAWKQVLSRLDSTSIGLRDEQKAGLVSSFVKQFAVNGKLGLETGMSREMIYSVLDSLESTQVLKNLLPDIRKQSRSASETVVQYLLDKHDAALQNNRQHDRLTRQEIQRFSQILGIKPKLQPVHAFGQSRIAAVKLGQAIRPAWANTATLGAVLMRQPVNEVINKVKLERNLSIQKMQNKLDTSKAVYGRVKRSEIGDTPS